MQDLNITMIQTSLAWEDPEANLSHFSQLISAYGKPTDLIILPEMFNTGFTMAAEKNAETMSGRTMEWISEMADINQCAICGSLIVEENKNYFNRLIWMHPDGSFDYYDKRHLFRMGDEHNHFSAGQKKLIVDLNGWKILPLICYDLRFPVWSKNTYSNGSYEYDLLVYVANWPAARIAVWTSLIKGRAIENLAYAAGVNRTGTDGRGYEYSGGSLVAAPWGEVIADTEGINEQVFHASLDHSALREIRGSIGAGKDWDEFGVKA